MLNSMNKISNLCIDNLTINLSMKCNMHCAYCYVYSQEVPEQVKQKDITLEEIKLVLEQYASLLQDGNEIKVLDITWHGGEPLTRGKEFFYELINLQKTLFENKKILVRNRLQSNGTLIDDEWSEFFYKYNFSLGISLDGPEEYHNINRYYINQKSSFNDTMRGIEILKKHNVSFGILSVITDTALNMVDKIYYFFKDLGIEFVDFIPSYLPEGGERVNVNPINWGNFLIQMFDLWKNDRSFEIGYLSDLLKKIRYKRFGEYNGDWLLCEFSGECGKHLSMTPDGNLYFCECLIGLDEYKLGNLYKDNISDMLSSRLNVEKKDAFNKKGDKCLKCNIYDICEGGCVKHKSQYTDILIMGYDIFCVSKKMIVDHIMKSVFGEKYE